MPLPRKKTPPTAEQMRLRLAGLCARSEQCEYDLHLKMTKAGLSAGDADSVIAFLKRERFLDNARYARAFARDKVRFGGWGRLKIRLALAAKRIPADVIAAALEDIDPADYTDAITRAAQAKARSLNLAMREDYMRLMRHLASRGFEPALAADVCRRLRKRSEEKTGEEEPQ